MRRHRRRRRKQGIAPPECVWGSVAMSLAAKIRKELLDGLEVQSRDLVRLVVMLSYLRGASTGRATAARTGHGT
jgi:hypothetical protein